MKKLALVFIIPLFFVFFATVVLSTNILVLENKRDAGDSTTVIYNKDWETVYSAVKYVWRHSENASISQQYGVCFLDYATEDKAIYATYSFTGATNVGVFLSH